MMVSQGGFGASTSGLGVRRIYEDIFGENGKEALFPAGPAKRIPSIKSTSGVRS
jgi:penicillin-binding protein 2